MNHVRMSKWRSKNYIGIKEVEMDIKTYKGRFWLLSFLITILFLATHNLGLITSFSYAAGEKDEWAKAVSAAKKEGNVVVFGPPGRNRRKALVGAFQQDFPEIKVKYLAGSGRKTSPRLLAERKAGKFTADIHIGGTTTIVKLLKPAGALDPIQPNLILSEVTDPSRWFKNKLWYSDFEEKYNFMFQGSVSSLIAYNTKLVDSKEITSYKDLLKPKWKGKIISADVRRPGPGGGQSRFLYATKDLGPEFLKKLFSETEITLSLDRRQIVDWLAQGKFALNIFASSIHVERAVDQGLPVGIILQENLKEGAPMTAGWGTVVVLNRAPHPNAAKVYLNWLLSRKGQMAWQKFAGAASLRTDISREGVRSWNLPIEGKDYFFVSLEKYATIETRKIRKIIGKAVEGRGK